MKYAKLIEGEIVFAPRKMPTEIGGEPYVVFNPPAEMLIAAGYKPVTYTDPPDDPPEGYVYVPGWEEEEDEIVQTWSLIVENIPAEEALDIIMGGGDDDES